MSLAVRIGISSLDAVLSSLRANHPSVETVILSWDRKHRSAAVMGVADETGYPLDVRADVLGRLTSLLAQPMHPDVLRLAYPDADLMLSGQIVLNIPVDEPTWARVLANVELRVQAGLRVPTEDVEDAVWSTLEAAGLPNGSVTLERRVMFPELPDDVVFEPVWLSTSQAGNGTHVSWDEATASFPHPQVGRSLVVLMNHLALRHEQSENLSAPKDAQLVLTRAVVSL